MTVKMLFLISPAYLVPTMRTSLLWKLIPTNTSLRVPSLSGTAWK